MRLAKKLGVLGLLAGLVAVLGLLAAGRTPTSAQVVIQDCSGPGAAPSTTITCTFPTIESIPFNGSIQISTTAPGVFISGVSINGIVGACTTTTGIGTQTVTLTGCGPLPFGTAITLTFTVPTSFAGINYQIPVAVTYNTGAVGGVPGNCTGNATITCVNSPGVAVPNNTPIDLQIQNCTGCGPLILTGATLVTGCAISSGFISGNQTLGVGSVIPSGSQGIVEILCNIGTVGTSSGTTFGLTFSCTATGTLTCNGAAVGEMTSIGGSLGTSVENIIFSPGFLPPINGEPSTDQCSTATGVPPVASGVVNCTVQTGNPILPGQSLQETPPAGSTGITCTTLGSNVVAPAAVAATFSGGVCVFASIGTAPIPAGALVGTKTFTVAAAATLNTILSELGVLCQTAVTPCVPVQGAVQTAESCEGIGCQVGPAPTPTPTPPTLNDPTGEEKFCSPVLGTVNNGLPAFGAGGTLGTGNQTAGPSTTFNLPAFSASPTTCVIVPTKGGVPCSGTNAATSCTDGYFDVELQTPGSVAVIGCQGNLNAATALGGLVGLPAPVAVSGGGGPCVPVSNGTAEIIPCGSSATGTNTGQFVGANGANGVLPVANNSCTGVLFTIQDVLSQCMSEPTITGCPPPGGGAYNFLQDGGQACVVVKWWTNPNAPTTGGIVLGTNCFFFQPPPLGTLLVTATPEAIPSNGTTASVVTATFACGNGFNLTSTGFPLSATGYSNFPGTTTIAGTTTTISTVNQPILGTAPGAVCGAGLPGTFTFASPGPVLFDNGRTTESVSCGLSAQDNPFGVGQLGNFNNLQFGGGYASPLTNPTFPLTFTCTGAAVLAIGAGAAGDAPINVTYQSAVGSLQAVGSSLIIVSPSGIPRISIACSPSVIAAGNTGSVCTATVTDQNGVPLTGITGATVTWTVSDPTEATIMPCVVNIGTAPAINVTTSPNVIPQVVPQTPCSPPSGSLPGQSNTFLNGQTTALLVASSYARPEVVSVSASLGVLIPPEFACLVSPYTPTGFGSLPSGGYPPIISGVGLPGLTGCGFSNPVGYTGLASALSTDSGGLTGIVTLPNTTSASTTVQIGGPAGILIAGATTTQPLGLLRGCNQIIVQTTAGTPIANIAALVSPAAAVVSIWAFNNSTKQFRLTFSSDPAAPVDFTTTGQTGATQQGSTSVAGTGGLAINAIPAGGTQVTEVYWVCVNQSANIISG